MCFFIKRPSAGVHITTGCTAGSLTACRLRTSCYTMKITSPQTNFLRIYFLEATLLFFTSLLFSNDESSVLLLLCFALMLNSVIFFQLLLSNSLKVQAFTFSSRLDLLEKRTIVLESLI